MIRIRPISPFGFTVLWKFSIFSNLTTKVERGKFQNGVSASPRSTVFSLISFTLLSLERNVQSRHNRRQVSRSIGNSRSEGGKNPTIGRARVSHIPAIRRRLKFLSPSIANVRYSRLLVSMLLCHPSQRPANGTGRELFQN